MVGCLFCDDSRLKRSQVARVISEQLFFCQIGQGDSFLVVKGARRVKTIMLKPSPIPPAWSEPERR
jgi:hypothetical protein